MDPRSEKYYSYSPYAYVMNNPMKFIDPTGMDWLSHIVDGITEVYYDREVTSQDGIAAKYGKNSGITHLSSGSKLTAFDKNGNISAQFTFTNDTKENKYGTVTDMNGNLLDGSKIEYGRKYIIFGTSDNTTNAETLHKNLFGTSYTKGDNPKDYLGNDFLSISSKES